MNILFVTMNKTNACAYYRGSGIAYDLKKKTNDSIVVAQWSEINLYWSEIVQYDIICFERPYNKMALDLCTYIKSCNRILWVDYDDNLLLIPQSNRAVLIYDEEAKANIKNILSIADVVSVTTEDLKQAFSEFNKNIWVIPNAFNDSIFKRRLLPKRSNIVAWRGTDTHIADLTGVAGAIDKICAEFPENQFLFLGYLPWFLNETMNKFFLKEMDIVIYFQNLMRMAPVVMQIPLQDNLFNRCKSNIGYLEGTYFGAACLVPDFWDAPGAFKYKTEDQYYDALKRLLSGKVDTDQMVNEAWEYIQDCLVLSKVNVKRVELINSL